MLQYTQWITEYLYMQLVHSLIYIYIIILIPRRFSVKNKKNKIMSFIFQSHYFSALIKSKEAQYVLGVTETSSTMDSISPPSPLLMPPRLICVECRAVSAEAWVAARTTAGRNGGLEPADGAGADPRLLAAAAQRHARQRWLERRRGRRGTNAAGQETEALVLYETSSRWLATLFVYVTMCRRNVSFCH